MLDFFKLHSISSHRSLEWYPAMISSEWSKGILCNTQQEQYDFCTKKFTIYNTDLLSSAQLSSFREIRLPAPFAHV